MNVTQDDKDFALLRRAFEVAKKARETGDHPFGCLLAGPDGEILMEQGNGYTAEGRDMTAHAERHLLATVFQQVTSQRP